MENSPIESLNMTREMENVFFLATLYLKNYNLYWHDTVENPARTENVSVGEPTDTILAR
jgi:hypothetical protein